MSDAMSRIATILRYYREDEGHDDASIRDSHYYWREGTTGEKSDGEGIRGATKSGDGEAFTHANMSWLLSALTDIVIVTIIIT